MTKHLRVAYAIARTAFMEAVSQPFAVLLLLSSMIAVLLAPVFQYHRFGEPGRLARDGGFSAILVFGIVFAVSSAVRTVARELESGTATVALARPVSRALFLCSKSAGIFGATLFFSLALFSATTLSAVSAVIGASLQFADDGNAHIFAPALLSGVLAVVAALSIAACVHRFARCRFCASAFCLLTVIQTFAAAGFVAVSFFCDFRAVTIGAVSGLAPVTLCIISFIAVFTVMAASLATRMRVAAVTAATVFVLLVSLFSPCPMISFSLVPDFRNFWMADALLRGGSLPWSYAAFAAVSASFICVVWLFIGSLIFRSRDIG